MIAAKSCLNCVHERQLEQRPVCLKYLCYLRLWRVCDDWNGGERFQKDVEGKAIWTFHHDHDPDADELAYLKGGLLEEVED